MNVTLTIDEIYAMKGIILGLEGLTRKICQDYRVDNLELLKKLEAVTDAWMEEKRKTPT